jgi:hypothetical protein
MAELPDPRQLVAEESKWKKLTGAVARITWPAEES